MDQALEVDGFALHGPQAVEAPGGRADFPDSGLLDGVTRGDAQGVLAGQFLEAFTRLVLEDGGFGEQVVRERFHGGAALAFLGFGAAGARAFGA